MKTTSSLTSSWQVGLILFLLASLRIWNLGPTNVWYGSHPWRPSYSMGRCQPSPGRQFFKGFLYSFRESKCPPSPSFHGESDMMHKQINFIIWHRPYLALLEVSQPKGRGERRYN